MVWLNDQHMNSNFPKDGVLRFGGSMCTCEDCRKEREFEQFKHDRNKALLSLNHNEIIIYMQKYNIPIPRPEVFWLAVHKSITANTELPIEFRKASKHYLVERNSESMDDGDI